MLFANQNTLNAISHIRELCAFLECQFFGPGRAVDPVSAWPDTDVILPENPDTAENRITIRPDSCSVQNKKKLDGFNYNWGKKKF